MINLISVTRLIGIVAVAYSFLVACVVLLYMNFSDHPSVFTALKFSLSGALLLNIFLALSANVWWRWLWRKIPILADVLFPDLNGKWRMTIHWSSGTESGTVNAVAEIRQSLLRVSMEVMSSGSDSETLIAHPRKDPESGRPFLLYVYRVVPKQLHSGAGHAYEGSAVLKYDATKRGTLSGNYFTSRFTKGYFLMVRH